MGGNELLKQGLSKSLDQIYYNYTFSTVRKYYDRTGPNPRTSDNNNKKIKIDVFYSYFLFHQEAQPEISQTANVHVTLG